MKDDVIWEEFGCGIHLRLSCRNLRNQLLKFGMENIMYLSEKVTADVGKMQLSLVSFPLAEDVGIPTPFRS